MADLQIESLEEVFSDSKETIEETTEVEAKAETEEVTEEVPEETVEQEDATTAKEKKPEEGEAWHLKAVKDERRKRQDAEREAEELRKQLDSDTEKKPRTSVFENEEQFSEEILSEIKQTVWNEKLNMSQFMLERELGEDVVSKKVEAFKELSKDNPAFITEFQSARSPYHKLVEIVDRNEAMTKFGSMDEWRKEEREKIRAEERAKIKEELEAETKAEKEKRESLTPSLANKRSSGGTLDVQEETLEEVMGS